MNVRYWLVLLLLFVTVPVLAQPGTPPQPQPPAPPTTPKDRASYSFGVMVGRGLQRDMKSQGLDVDFALIMRGIADALNGKALLTDPQMQESLAFLEQQAQRAQAQRNVEMQQQGAKNKQAGEAFLAANRQQPDVKTLPSGLQYKVLKSGTGDRPTKTDRVRTHYHGTLIDGTVFDSSVQRGEPVEFEVGGVIPGWTEALQLMRVGDKWQLFIPPDLAYGPRGAGEMIGSNATLIFEIELLGINP